MMRIIAGNFGGRRFKVTPPPGIRPTSDKLRETLFNVLGARVAGAVFLDAYAGMGGVGIEAISRGAKFVYFVDQSKKAGRIIRDNLTTLAVKTGFHLLETELTRALAYFEKEGIVFDIVFLDPPYERQELYAADLQAFGTRSLLAKDGILIVEHSKRFSPDAAGNLVKYRSLTHGDSSLSFFRVEDV